MGAVSDVERGVVLEHLEAAQQAAVWLETGDGWDGEAFAVHVEALVDAVIGARAALDRITAEQDR